MKEEVLIKPHTKRTTNYEENVEAQFEWGKMTSVPFR